MAYLLGNKACMDSLFTDVQDIHWTIRDIVSRVGPLSVKSWKFPDQTACNVDIDDLLDLYSCDDDNDDAEEKQVAHIALYELVIDRLLLLVQATAKFAGSNLGTGLLSPVTDDTKMAGSVGIVVKQFWTQISSLQSVYQQLQSENKSKESKVNQLERELGKHSPKHTGGSTPPYSPPPTFDNEHNYFSYPKTPGTLGLIPPNKADMVFMGLAPQHEKDISISKDTNNKSCQTYETCLVPCESCEFVQRKLREAGDVVIKVCSDQGLPCSLKKFKVEVAHVKALRFSDVCRWMAEQNKDIARIGKQNELLQATIDPLKKEVKACGRKVREAEDNAKTYENRMKEEKQTQSVLRDQIQMKMKDKEKQHQEEMGEEIKQRAELQRAKEKLDQEMKLVKQELKEQAENLKALELEYKLIDKELAEKRKVAQEADSLKVEVSSLKENLEKLESQLEGTTQALAREKGKVRSVNSHNEVIIRNLESEKEILSNSLKESQASISELETRLEEAKERERMIVEYPDLNGPVNPDLSGTGDIMVDMQNQVTANTIRMKLLEEQNSSLSQSISKLSGMHMTSGEHMAESKPREMRPIPLWQQNQSTGPVLLQGRNANNSSQYEANQVSSFLEDKPPPPFKQHAWTFESQNNDKSTTPDPHGKHSLPDPSQEFVVGRSHTPSTSSSRRPKSMRQGRPSSAKLQTINAPVNATPIGAYTQMKQALGILSGIERPKKGRSSSNKSGSGRRPQSMPVGGTDPCTEGGSLSQEPTTPFSCPHCDKMYLKARDLDIHLSYCAANA